MTPMIVEHPLLQHKISILRNKQTGTKEFRDLVGEIATLLCYEATRDLPLEEVEIETPITMAKTKVLAGRKLALVPILRAGMGMLDGMLTLLPAVLSTLPIPEWLVFAIMFFVGGAISGSNGIIALGTPLAFSTLDGGIPLMVLLMCMCHAASLISPVHVCLVVASDYFKITMGQLIRKTIPASLVFALLMIGYYLLLTAIV